MTLARRGRARSVSRHDSFPSMERVREALSAALGDRYRIERVLGRGGMATVYVAEDFRHRREVAIAARLTHPHVLPLIDSGQADGSLYYVMPYVRGETLRERLVREQRFALKDALRIARELGAGLDYAHREGFVHRDVKPENVLLADGHAVLADFGIARAIFQAGGEHVTEVGLAIGTPEYMSPEQAAGDRELDGRCDEYALACVVYEMLAGEPPFSGDSARAIVAKHLSEPPAPLRARRPDAPAAVEQALARALAKAPADRFASVAEFTAALEETRPGAAPSLVGRTRSIAVLPFVNASADPDNEYLSDGISDELINALTKVDGLRIASRTSAFALKGKPQDIRAIGALLGVSAVLEGTVRQSGDRLRITAQLAAAEDGRALWSERSDQSARPSSAAASCAVMRRRSPDCRTVPSSTAETPSSAPMARMSCGFPLRANADVREAMRRPSTLVSALISSSLMPSLRYSLSGSALAFTNGSTAMERVLPTSDGAAPGRVSSRAAVNSATLANRSAGAFASARASACSTAAGASGRRARSGAGGSLKCLATMARALSPENGGSPASISYTTQARAYSSHRPSSSRSPAACSGLMYSGVPMASPTSVTCSPPAWKMARAIPKSASTACPSARSTFSGFTSRWTNPSRCA